MAFAGDTLRAEGEVTEVRENVVVLEQRVLSGERVAAEAVTEIRLAD
jgi:acyl dehydratase